MSHPDERSPADLFRQILNIPNESAADRAARLRAERNKLSPQEQREAEERLLARLAEEEAEFEEMEKRLESFERSFEEIAKRMLCLLAVAARSGGALNEQSFRSFSEDRGLMEAFTARELAFAQQPDPLPQKESVQMSWRIEACNALCFVLGLTKGALSPSSEQVNPANLWVPLSQFPVDFWREMSLPQDWREKTREALFYAEKEHWRVNDARHRGAPMPTDFHPGVAIERHRAFNWVIGHTDGDWEETWMDT